MSTKKILLEIEDLSKIYRCSLPNEDILDNLNLKEEDLQDVKFIFAEMPGYLYDEAIPFLGNTTVGGGSIGVELVTNKGMYMLQPFMRYDEGHRQGLKEAHLNPKLRVIDPNGDEFYLPDKSTKYNVFGNEMPEVMIVSYPLQWRCLDSDGKIIDEGTIKEKKKRKP